MEMWLLSAFESTWLHLIQRFLLNNVTFQLLALLSYSLFLANGLLFSPTLDLHLAVAVARPSCLEYPRLTCHESSHPLVLRNYNVLPVRTVLLCCLVLKLVPLVKHSSFEDHIPSHLNELIELGNDPIVASSVIFVDVRTLSASSTRQYNNVLTWRASPGSVNPEVLLALIYEVSSEPDCVLIADLIILLVIST